jgi:hypothetical protein
MSAFAFTSTLGAEGPLLPRPGSADADGNEGALGAGSDALVGSDGATGTVTPGIFGSTDGSEDQADDGFALPNGL